MDLHGRRALVTGASSGIGEAIARDLAARGASLVIAARRADRLARVADELTRAHGVAVEVVVVDLGATGGALSLWQRATSGGRTIDVLVNNAGFGYHRPFTAADWARDAELLQLNVVALVQLCHHFVSAHRARASTSAGAGAAARSTDAYILNVASTASFQAIPNFASYAASKAYVRSFSEALHYELGADGIGVTCLCPGGTVTEFHQAAGTGNYGAIANLSMLSADAVASVGVRGMLRRKKTVVPGLLNKLSVFFGGLAGSAVASRAARFLMGSPRATELPTRTDGGADDRTNDRISDRISDRRGAGEGGHEEAADPDRTAERS